MIRMNEITVFTVCVYPKSYHVRKICERKYISRGTGHRYNNNGMIKLIEKIAAKLFRGLDMSWKNVILFALGAAVYTALMALLVQQSSSFHDIVVTSELWAMFGVIIFMNCKTPNEAATKVFVFFLISQPLIYLLQIPFHKNGANLLTHYPFWFMITVLTAPAAWIGWQIHHRSVTSALILSLGLIIIIYYGMHYVFCMVVHFPAHLLTVLLCITEVLLLIYGLLPGWHSRRLAFILCFLAAVIFGIRRFTVPFVDKTALVFLDKTKYPLDETWLIIPRNESVSTADFAYTSKGPALMVHFYNCSNNVITMFDNDHHEYRIDIHCDKDLNVFVEDRKPYFRLFGQPIQR